VSRRPVGLESHPARVAVQAESMERSARPRRDHPDGDRRVEIPMRILLVAALVLAAPDLVTGQQLPRAIFTDPPRDSAHPARMETLQIPSGGVNINGIAYLASGAGAHPTVVFFHGLPGNE